jgi:hypothetical protein
MKLDWQHVVLLIVGAACVALAIWFGQKSANPAILAVGVTAGTAYLATILALFKSSPSETQTTTATVTLKEPTPPGQS